MTPLRVLIVDDEPLARLRLRTLLGAIAEPATVVVGEAGDAGGALALLAAAPVDLLLLDIAMPARDGLALARALRAAPAAPAIVFVTAHAAHALAAFDVDAVDYLTKPVRRERLEAALARVRERRGAAAAAPVVVVAERGRVRRVPLADVLYLKAEHKYVTLRTAARSYLVDDPLEKLEAQFGAATLLRIHRNALVAPAAVGELDERTPGQWALRIAPTGEWLAVSRRQLAAVRDALAR